MPRLDIGPSSSELLVDGDRVTCTRSFPLRDRAGKPLSGAPIRGGCQSTSKLGSDTLSVQQPLSCGHQSGFEEIEVGAVVHLAFDELQTVDLTFDLTA